MNKIIPILLITSLQSLIVKSQYNYDKNLDIAADNAVNSLNNAVKAIEQIYELKEFSVFQNEFNNQKHNISNITITFTKVIGNFSQAITNFTNSNDHTYNYFAKVANKTADVVFNLAVVKTRLQILYDKIKNNLYYKLSKQEVIDAYDMANDAFKQLTNVTLVLRITYSQLYAIANEMNQNMIDLIENAENKLIQQQKYNKTDFIDSSTTPLINAPSETDNLTQTDNPVQTDNSTTILSAVDKQKSFGFMLKIGLISLIVFS